MSQDKISDDQRPASMLRAVDFDMDDEESNVAQGSTADFCERWPAEVNGEGHAFVSTKPAGTTLWIRRCSFCGWIDGADLESQVEALRTELSTTRRERDALIKLRKAAKAYFAALLTDHRIALPVAENLFEAIDELDALSTPPPDYPRTYDAAENADWIRRTFEGGGT